MINMIANIARRTAAALRAHKNLAIAATVVIALSIGAVVLSSNAGVAAQNLAAKTVTPAVDKPSVASPAPVLIGGPDMKSSPLEFPPVQAALPENPFQGSTASNLFPSGHHMTDAELAVVEAARKDAVGPPIAVNRLMSGDPLPVAVTTSPAADITMKSLGWFQQDMVVMDPRKNPPAEAVKVIADSCVSAWATSKLAASSGATELASKNLCGQHIVFVVGGTGVSERDLVTRVLAVTANAAMIPRLFGPKALTYTVIQTADGAGNIVAVGSN